MPNTDHVVMVPADKLTDMAQVIDDAIAHHKRFNEIDEEWLSETSRRLRALAAGADD